MIAVALVVFRLYEVHSLKEKRAVMRPLLEGIRAKHKISIAEIDHLDSYRQSVVEFAVVGNEKKHLEKVTQRILQEMETYAQLEVVQWEREVWDLWEDG